MFKGNANASHRPLTPCLFFFSEVWAKEECCVLAEGTVETSG
jgi:hypothetical protein